MVILGQMNVPSHLFFLTFNLSYWTISNEKGIFIFDPVLMSGFDKSKNESPFQCQDIHRYMVSSSINELGGQICEIANTLAQFLIKCTFLYWTYTIYIDFKIVWHTFVCNVGCFGIHYEYFRMNLWWSWQHLRVFGGTMDGFVSMNCNDLGEIVVHCSGCISNTWVFGLYLACIWLALTLVGCDFSCIFL